MAAKLLPCQHPTKSTQEQAGMDERLPPPLTHDQGDLQQPFACSDSSLVKCDSTVLGLDLSQYQVTK